MSLVGVMHMDSWGFYDTDSPPWIRSHIWIYSNILAFIFVTRHYGGLVGVINCS